MFKATGMEQSLNCGVNLSNHSLYLASQLEMISSQGAAEMVLGRPFFPVGQLQNSASGGDEPEHKRAGGERLGKCGTGTQVFILLLRNGTEICASPLA